MCGIAGFFNLSGAPADAAVLARMLSIQRHRGPDDEGMRLFSLASGRSAERPARDGASDDDRFEGALGFNRLSILDLSTEGHQPMTNADASVFLAFNGEIYNAFDFTAELRAAGFRFHSKTDTEVILYLYERYGLDGMLQRLNGMFAIVIVDLRRREINIARDHFGIKPLYWARVGQTVLFGSEVKAFLQHPAFRARLNEDCLDEYLAFRYCAGDRFLLEDVHQLRAGHCMRITPQGVTVRRYWEIPDPEKPRTTDRHATDRLDDLLRSSVQSQLLSDVQVGCQLSGGVDSSMVTAHARTHFDADMKTFSVVFQDQKYSEERWIDQASKTVGVESHRLLFTPDQFFGSLEEATWHMDQPINHPNSLGIYFLAQRATKLVTVLLSGEGADEVFGGYPRHYYASLRPRVQSWMPLLTQLPKWGPKFARNFGANQGDDALAFIASSMFIRPDQLHDLRPEADLARAAELRRDIFSEGRGQPLDNCLKYDMQTYMVDLLVRQDKMTMAHSVENRVPFLDLHLVNFVRSLPVSMLIGSGVSGFPIIMRNTKMLLKGLARRRFDDAFLYRSKSGFGLPLREYYSDPRFETLMKDRLLPGMKRRGLVRHDVVERQWRDIVRNRRDGDESFWIPVALELWAQQYLDTGAPAL
jgi:asparagine synthase (glutamine-hydrolysing)